MVVLFVKSVKGYFWGIVFILSMYSLITAKNEAMPYILFFFGAMAFVVGITELKEKRKTIAVYLFLYLLLFFLFSLILLMLFTNGAA